MAVQHGMPGEWAKVRGTVQSLWPLFLCFFSLGAFASALVLGRQTLLFGVLLVASLALTAFIWRKGVLRVESFYKGARGEERAAEILAALPEDWHVFHDFKAGDVHVDHVVVGPNGVFSIETKNWNGVVTVEEGEVLVNGRLPSRSPVEQAEHEAREVRKTLEKSGWKGETFPVVCFASDAYAETCGQVGETTIVNANALIGWMLTRPHALAPNELARLAQLIETNVG